MTAGTISASYAPAEQALTVDDIFSDPVLNDP